MKLYHGTTEAVARLALTEGLLPRENAGVDSRWPNCPSRPDMIYLTDAYAPYFASCALDIGSLMGIVEVDTDLLDEDLFHPDEDFLEQGTRSPDAGVHLAPFDASMEERTEFYRERLESFQHTWLLSMEHLGNCAYQGEIPSEAVTRIALIDPSKAPLVLQIGMDPCITLLNYQICGHKYRSLTNWIFGAEITPEDLMFFSHPDWPEQMKKSYYAVEEILRGREGISIFETVQA